MEQALDFAQGPLFRLAFVILIAGLMRRFVLIAWPMFVAWFRARDRSLHWASIFRDIGVWLVPIGHVWRSRDIFTIVSYAFHIGLILVPVFLMEHVSLWTASSGLALPVLPKLLADTFTIVTILGVSILLVVRIVSRLVRTFTRTEDYVALLLILVPFLSGLLAGRSWNPLSYNAMLLIHILSAEALMITIPFSKLSHCIFFPFSRLCAELGSKLVTDSEYLYKSPLSEGGGS